jgi:hypothetical protein
MLPDEADTQPDSAGPMPTRSRERRGAFGLQGRRTDGLPDGGPQEEGDPDQEGEAGQVLGGAELYAEAAALGIPRPMRRSSRATRSARGSSRPGFFLPWGPDPEDPDSDGLVLPEVDRLPGVEEPATRRTTASAPAEAGTPRPDESPGRTAGPPSGRPPAGYGPAASGTYAPTHFATGISASCEGCHLDRDRPRPPAS